jgi:hypothetical protein
MQFYNTIVPAYHHCFLPSVGDFTNPHIILHVVTRSKNVSMNTYRFFGCEAAMEVNLRPTNITHEPALPGFPVLISRFSASSSYKGWSRVYPAGRSAQGFHCPRRFRPRLFLSPLDRWILSLEKRERPQNQEIASLYRRGLVSSLGDGTKRRY